LTISAGFLQTNSDAQLLQILIYLQTFNVTNTGFFIYWLTRVSD